MTSFFQTVFTRYPVKTRRLLEVIPGFIAWSLILAPIWGSLLFPYVIAYFIIFFDIYWLYKSLSLTVNAYIASKKIAFAEKQNWRLLTQKLPDFDKVYHVIIIPNFKENMHKMRASLQTMAEQTFPTERLVVVLAMEKREENARQKAETLIEEFKNVFGHILATYHPDIPGEVKGKSSNQAYAAKIVEKKLIAKKAFDMKFATVSSVDADSLFDKQYFSYLAYSFLSDSKRYNKFWQSANVNYSNFWSVPAPIRVISFFGSLWRTALLIQGDRLVVNSTYSLSFSLLKKIGYWDTDVIPEDYRIFFKAFYKENGNIWVKPIFLKTFMDAPLSSSYFKSLKNKYNQERRWSWGVSDDPLFVKWWLTAPNVPFFRKTTTLFNVLLDHFLWPVNWFIITIAANVMPLINPVFSRTTLGYNLPQLAGLILTFCIFSTLIMIVIDLKHRPKSLISSKTRQLLFPLEFVLLPIVGFFFSALPALISHTQLMLGKRLEYEVTEKL